MTNLGDALKTAGYRPPKLPRHGARNAARLRTALAHGGTPTSFLAAYREGLARLAAKGVGG